MRLIGLAVVLALTIVPFVAEAQEDQLSECLRTHFLKEIKALEKSPTTLLRDLQMWSLDGDSV